MKLYLGKHCSDGKLCAAVLTPVGKHFFVLFLAVVGQDPAENFVMEQCDLKNVNNYLNTNISSYLETSSGQSSNLYLNVVHFFNTSVN